MTHEENPMRGIVFGLAISLPFWAAVAWWAV